MKKNKFDTVIDESSSASGVSNDALELNSDELYTERKYHFKIRKEFVSIYKEALEPYIHILTEALAYYIYKPLYPTLQIEPPLHRKYKADLIAFNYSNEPLCWIECFERDFDKIEYICKHMQVEEMILLEVSDDITQYIDLLKRKVHYKFHHMITVVNIQPETIFYIDPDEVILISDWYDIIEL